MSKNSLQEVLKKYQSHPEFLGDDLTDPNQGFDETVLHIAARKGAVEDVEILISAGAEVNRRGDIGNTPMHEAAIAGQSEVVKILLQLGADPTLKNEYGQTAHDVAKLGEHAEIVQLLSSD